MHSYASLILARKFFSWNLPALGQGLIHEIFTTILRGLSGAKVTKPGKFRSCQDGYAVKSSLKAEDGVLYPLEKSFFFLPKPPTLILHEEVQLVYLHSYIWSFMEIPEFDQFPFILHLIIDWLCGIWKTCCWWFQYALFWSSYKTENWARASVP